jgi:hypothetical protein
VLRRCFESDQSGLGNLCSLSRGLCCGFIDGEPGGTLAQIRVVVGGRACVPAQIAEAGFDEVLLLPTSADPIQLEALKVALR